MTALLPSNVTAPFVGREPELGTFAGAMAELHAGRGSVLVVAGEPGMGKTRFLQEALARTTSPAAPVQLFTATARELDRLRPFGVVADGLEVRAGRSEEAAAVAALLAGEVSAADAAPLTLAFSPWRRDGWAPGMVAEASHLQMRIIEAVATVVDRLCTRSPVVLVVDDAQWADVSSLLALERMAQETARLPVLLVCSHRPQTRDAELWGFLDALPPDRTRRLRLEALTDAEVRALVAAGGHEPDPTLGRAAGNPFFLLELLHAQSTGGAGDVPPSVSEAVARRVAVLPPATQQLLQVASVLGTTFTAANLSVVVGRPVSELAGALHDALASEILVERDGAVAFRHDLLREALYEGLPASVRRGLHLQAASALTAAEARADLVAEHLMRGAGPDDAGAVAALHAAARQAGPLAPAISLKLLRRALELAGPDDPAYDRIVADQVAILNWAGEAAEVERLGREVLGRIHDPATEPLVRLCLAQSLLGRGRLGEALAELQLAIDAPALSAVERARFRAWASKCLMLLGRSSEAAEAARVAMADADAAGDSFARVLSTAVLALMTNFAGHYREALTLADQAIALADGDATATAHRFPLHLYQSALLLDVDELDAAQAAVSRGRRISEQLGTAWNLPMYHLISSVHRFWSGEWDDAIAEFDTGRELADEIGGRIGMVAAFGLRSVIAVHRGDLRTAEEAAADGERELAATGPQYRADWLLWARALLLESRGDVVGAIAVLSAAWEGCTAAGIVAEYPILGPDLVRLSLARGDRRGAEAVFQQVQAAAPADIPSLAAVTLRCQSMLTGSLEDARSSAAAHRLTPRLLDRALAYEEAGLVLAPAHPDEARALLQEAAETYESLGATAGVARVDGRLRSLGVHRGRRGSRPGRPAHGWEALTRTELSVARLVSEGLSNADIAERLFISPRTARTHVSHALLKLGFRSRAELAAEVVRRNS